MITTSVTKLKNEPAAKIIIVSYSPTGGGHTARLLNIVTMALEKKSIPANSIVLFHLPCPWEGTPRSPIVTELAKNLCRNKIHVWMAESDKSIYGYLNKNTGGSDDASILQHITQFPLRNTHLQPAGHKIITTLSDSVYFRTEQSLDNLPVISAKNLMASLLTTFGQIVISERCYVLTDMDPYLHKAASAIGIPNKRRLDQQNHAILLNINDQQLNLLPKYALLSKVLGGYGEGISHIDLGGRNTLTSLIKITTELEIYSETPKNIARRKIAKLLISYALPQTKIEEKLADKNRPFSGVMVGKAVNMNSNVSNIIYVYAHKKTNLIAQCINDGILSQDPLFQEIIFLFCGPNATGNKNSMHLAYIADADGITTAGAGTVGEYAYLRKKSGCTSRLLILPIEGHNEQEKNAEVISEDTEIKSFVMRKFETEQLSEALKRFISGKPRENEAPFTMKEFIKAISDPNSYVQQAYDLLFTESSSINFKNIIQIEKVMNSSPLLRATRKYLKLIFQALDETEKNPVGPIKIVLQQGKCHTFSDIAELNSALNNAGKLAPIIGLPINENINQMPLIDEVKHHFNALAKGNSSFKRRKTDLKEEFGEFMVTGF